MPKKFTLKDFGMVPIKRNKDNVNETFLSFQKYINDSIDTYINDNNITTNEKENLGKILKALISYNDRLQKTYNPPNESDSD